MIPVNGQRVRREDSQEYCKLNKELTPYKPPAFMLPVQIADRHNPTKRD